MRGWGGGGEGDIAIPYDVNQTKTDSFVFSFSDTCCIEVDNNFTGAHIIDDVTGGRASKVKNSFR